MAVEALQVSVNRGWLYHPIFPEHWTPRALQSMARWVNGIAFKDIQFTPTGRPVIKIAEIKGGLSGQTKFTQQTFDDSVRVRPGDLLFSWSGQPETSIDAFWWRGPEGWLNQHVFRVTTEDGIDTVFFYYLLRYLKPNFVGIASNKQTTGLGHVTKRDLENIQAAYPEFPEQRAIANILGTLDDKIELNRKMAVTLEAMARAIFRDCLEQASEERRLDDLCDIFDGPHATPNIVSDGPIFLGISNLSDGRLDLSDTRHVTEDDFVRWTKRVTPVGGDIVFSYETRLGEVARIPTGLRCCLGRRMGLLRPKKEQTSSAILLYAYLSPAFQEVIRARTIHGSTVDRIPLIEMGSFPILIPESETERRIAPVLESLRARMEQGYSEACILAALRDALLPKLISGDLQVKDAERFLVERGL
jgi:type I restriction enzyme S subunit